MGRADLPGPLEARNHLFGLIVQEPRSESLTFRDALDRDGDRLNGDFEPSKARVAYGLPAGCCFLRLSASLTPASAIDLTQTAIAPKAPIAIKAMDES